MSDTAPTEPADQSWGCYRHPYEEAGVRCTRCDRPICPKCMITAPVGFQCPECVKGAPPVRRYSEMRQRSTADTYATMAIIAINVAVFFPSLQGATGNRLANDYALFGPAIAAGEWWRLITSGFLHEGLLHVGLNMFILYRLGQMLEPVLGRVRFACVYMAALLGGSVGAVLLSPNVFTVGASGAIFGLMGVAAVMMQNRGVNIMQSSIGGLIIINLVLTFAIPGISIGGHVGGLFTGAASGFIFERTDKQPLVGAAIVAALGLALFGVGLAVA